ncbi:MAG: hypothetical protein K2G60_06710, partial [Oscillospiraceae bacterium]|nr:hypothetical protein [Oscillospiraceae bacterium]
CNIVLDVWTTYISRININYLMLQRGHAPLAAVDVDKYLENPIENNTYLLAPDINYGTCDNVKTSADAILNDGEMFACIATLSDPRKAFGTKYEENWITPSYTFNKEQGVPSYFVFAMDTENLAAFMQAADENIPQFKQTVQAVFFVAKKLVTAENSFTFLNTTCYTLAATQKNMKLLDLKKEDFKYPEEYAHLTKLYTYPYAYVEISDASGQVLTVKIENTDGNISIEALLSIAFPHLGIDVFFGGVGGENERSISFKNIDLRSVTIGGRWYEYFQHWDIPCFEVVQEAGINYDFSTHWKREQMKYDAETSYANAEGSANTTKTNAINSANTTLTNTNNSANVLITNTQIGNTASTANQATANAVAAEIMANNNLLASNTQTKRNNLQLQLVDITNQTNTITTGISSGANLVGNLANDGAGLLNGNVAGAIAGAIGGVFSYNAANESVLYVNGAAYDKTVATTNTATEIVQQQNATNTTNTYDTNSGHTTNTARIVESNISQANNDAATTKTNASNTNTTEIANANRTYNQTITNAQRSKTAEYQTITNNIRQAKLNTPLSFGINKGNSSDVTMPQMLTANLVTQSQGEIAQVANEFLRYGYNLGQQWTFNGFSVMKNFSYWKASEVWLYSESGVNNAILDYIRAILIKGTTVWSDPNKVCAISIFEN